MKIRKLFLFFLLAAVTVCPGCLAEGICFSVDGIAMILGDAGVKFLGVENVVSCCDIIPGSLFAVGCIRNDQLSYSLYTEEGIALTYETYDMIREQSGVLIFRKGSLFGAMTLNGELIIEPVYTQLTTGDGMHFLVTKTDVYDDEPDAVFSLIPGQEPLPLDLRTNRCLEPFSDGLMRFRAADRQRYGYLDTYGNTAIPPVFEAAEPFSAGTAKVQMEGYSGLIDTSGIFLVPCIYDSVQKADGFFLCEGEAGAEVLEASDRTRVFLIDQKYSACTAIGCFIVLSDDSATRILDSSGEVVAECSPAARAVEGLDGGLILFDGLWGESCCTLMDRSGKMLGKGYQQLQVCGELFVYAVFRGVPYISRELNEIRYSCDENSVMYGILSGSGEVLMPAACKEIRCIGKDRYLLLSGSELLVIDGQGEAIWRFSSEKK